METPDKSTPPKKQSTEEPPAPNSIPKEFYNFSKETLLIQLPIHRPETSEETVVCYKEYCKHYYINVLLINQVTLK